MIELFEGNAVFWEGLFPDEGKRGEVQNLIQRVSVLESLTSVVLIRFKTGGERLFLLFKSDEDTMLKDNYDVIMCALNEELLHQGTIIEDVPFPQVDSEDSFEDFIKRGAGDLKDSQIVTLWRRQSDEINLPSVLID